MRKPILAFSILAFSILACSQASPEQIRKYTATPSITSTATPTPANTPSPLPTLLKVLAATSTPDRFHSISILAAFLNVRSKPDGDVTGEVLRQGNTARASCAGTWCELESGGYVWRGCTNDNPESLGCSER